MRIGTSRHLSGAVWAIVFGVCVALAAPTAARASCDAALGKAAQIGKSVTDVVANASLSTNDRLNSFRRIFKQNANFPAMAQFALGRYWKRLPNSKRGEYFDLVENLVVQVLFGQLESYAGQRYSINTSRCFPKGSRGMEFWVEGSVLNGSGARITDVKFWFLGTGSRMKLFDFQVAGIWLTQQKRDEFASFLRAHGGDTQLLLNDLRRRTGA